MDEYERVGRENYETYHMHCMEESPYWVPIWHPIWDELTEESRQSWIAGAKRDKTPQKETIKPFF